MENVPLNVIGINSFKTLKGDELMIYGGSVYLEFFGDIKKFD